jgi:DNA-directed RNA polymerase subunit M/transcription elongation factor TFIIS
LIRNCPKCGKEILHTTKRHRNFFDKRKIVCKSCSKSGNNHYNFGKHLSNEHKQSVSKSLKGKIPKNIEIFKRANFTRVISDETKEKMRVSRIRFLKETGLYCYPNNNPKANEYFFELEKTMGWDGKYASKNGEFEIGDGKYFVDYYEPNLNIVVEYDEPHHYKKDGSLKNKDVKRMGDIKQLLECKFLRYNEVSKKLVEY